MSDNLSDRLLRLMSDGGWHSSQELVEKISHRFSATMHVLKKRGHQFEQRHIERKRYEWRLKA